VGPSILFLVSPLGAGVSSFIIGKVS
jgi:hypothetical protein